ncbi:alanine dehydrogenase [Staphylococcus chromogenes]|uniref:Alanine dehydrogenase n=1 Tax=Staphylococcus chromogenes TaxID=46126 RepID=A0AAX0ZIP0_STACR|nr:MULTISPECIES: alanine dehydrogenase [Staphylococcus]KDP13041.1 alanine dehydrogenase [Staphylococcus chromogenes MU 970]MBV5137955.1 alanine dehydrogenase [Staphylococcus chromogenes]MBW6088006.1 alanine dehydrogenase [Staphylococcus chromogenes]MCD9059104.1 alanine dehydrogenase [Staphylococcus chromogenes]MCD9061357.1 alanine dehydrogenase [Staphylococcus chromogenes]
MKIGIPKEIKNNENRVGLSPSGVHALVEAGHTVLVEQSAGIGSFFEDQDYVEAGAKIVDAQTKVWDVDMVIKVKEPLKEEYDFFREGLILFTYLHLANEPELTEALIKNKVVAIAYETVQLADRSLPLLTPMSEVAGRMSAQIGAQFLQKINGGMGILLGGIPGVQKGKVTIIGGGQAGTNAARIALGLGADVTILDVNPKRLQQLEELFDGRVHTIMSNPLNIEEHVKASDLVIGAVLIPGAKAPRLVTEDMIKQMKAGSVVVDIAIDQGGIFETTDRITTHDDPTYVKHGVVHYAVANMPGAVPRTSTIGLNNATLPYALQLANKGYKQALTDNVPLSQGLNTYNGLVTNKAVAEAFNKEFTPVADVLK